MTKVDELREMILHWNRYSDVPRVSQSAVDNLIDAARSEGVAEGAEQERERIRKTAQVWLAGDPPPNDTWHGVDKKELDPASVLAPTKEVAG